MEGTGALKQSAGMRRTLSATHPDFFLVFQRRGGWRSKRPQPSAAAPLKNKKERRIYGRGVPINRPLLTELFRRPKSGCNQQFSSHSRAHDVGKTGASTLEGGGATNQSSPDGTAEKQRWNTAHSKRWRDYGWRSELPRRGAFGAQAGPATSALPD